MGTRNSDVRVKDKLGDYAYAFARSEKFDAMKAETIVRDLFKERTGRSMNQLREALIEREKTIGEAETPRQRHRRSGPSL